ncbi:MAG: NAD(P)H-binding protein [Actinomyces sp.]|uniref:NAD(P)H-binding protein n=1 Tax=Actinomyces sp. TaxID=29317 RepID=UPI0026DB069A|nr:NAD(P)H-binding protein [Actinomyces sp.]MDO4243342.1 NAD(P)H-binding protein [Actinomyces sp.]
MTIAITGASGNLGRLVIEDLITRSFPTAEIVAIVRTRAKISDLAERGAIVREASYGDVPALTAALDGVDRVLLVSIPGPGARDAHRSVVDAAKAAGVSHLAYTSIPHADTSSNPLAIEHAATEIIISESGLPATILRNAWYHEVYTRALGEYLAAGEVVGSTGDGRVAGAARADFAVAAATVLTTDGHTGHTYELGGESFTLADLAATVAKVSGKPVAHRNLTTAEHIAHLQSSGIDVGTASFIAAVDASIAKGEMDTDSGDLTRLVGRPLRPLAESIRAAL